MPASDGADSVRECVRTFARHHWACELADRDGGPTAARTKVGAGRAGRGLRERPLGPFKPVDLLLQRDDALVDAFGEFGDRHQLTG